MDINKARALFFEEAYEQCDNLEHALLDRDTYPANPDTYNLMFRTAHTIKGSAGMLGLAMLVRFAHAMENMLERLRSGEIALDEHSSTCCWPATINCATCCREPNTTRATADRDPADPGLALPTARAPDPAQPAADHAGSRTGQSDGSARLAPLPALLSRPLSGRLRSAGLHSLPRQPGEIHVIQPVWQEWPPLQLLDATECFLGYEIGLLSAEPAERIRSTFDFVAHASLICLLSPIRIWRSFQNRGKSWRPGAMSRSRPSCSAGCRLAP